jgi:SAM-dependent methyltransferase
VTETGNVAKRYCLELIERRLVEGERNGLEILDLGCGDATAFIDLLEKHPSVHYVGVEPDGRVLESARARLGGRNVEWIEAAAYGIDRRLERRFPIVTSFSVLEHVYRRREYLEAAVNCLEPGGTFYINYDAGHFTVGKERLKNLLAPWLARLGHERFYQAFVPEKWFRTTVAELGLRIVDEKFFNSHLKGIHKNLPEGDRAAFAERWYELELWLNETSFEYRDEHASLFGTRNFVLTRKGLS